MRKITGKLFLASIVASLILSTACQSSGETSVVPPVETEATQSIEETSTSGAAETEVTDVIETTIEPTQQGGAQQLVNPNADQIAAAQKFSFTAKGLTFTPEENADPVINHLGDAKTIYQAPSCAFEGEDTVYAYDGFEVNTANYKGQEVVVGIFLTDENVSTPAGIKLGSSLEDVLAAYGDPDSDEMGQLTWVDEQCNLTIVVLGDEVTSISLIGNFDS